MLLNCPLSTCTLAPQLYSLSSVLIFFSKAATSEALLDRRCALMLTATVNRPIASMTNTILRCLIFESPQGVGSGKTKGLYNVESRGGAKVKGPVASY